MEKKCEEISYKKIVICFILACVTVWAFVIGVKQIDMDVIARWGKTNSWLVHIIKEVRYLMAGYGILNAFIAIGFTVFYYKLPWKNYMRKYWNVVLAIFFALCMVLGQAFQANNSWELLFSKKIYIVFTVIRLIGFFIFFFGMISCIDTLIERKVFLKEKVGRITIFLFDKHSIIGPFLFIVIAWLPYLISCYPGVVQWDGLRQLENFSHLSQSDNSHPVFTTLLMGICMSIGKILKNDNLGVFIYILPQFIMCAFVFAYSIHFVKRFNTPYWIRWMTLFFFSFISLWPLYAVSLFKDTLYYMVFLCYILLNIQVLMEGDLFWSSKKQVIGLITIAVLLCLIRPNGIYVVFLSMPFWIVAFSKKKAKRNFIVLILVTVFLVSGFNKIVVPGLGVAPGRKQEAYCAFMQQTARYVKTYGKEVTDEEKKVISEVYDYELLSEVYNPEYADPVKNQAYKPDVTDKEFKEYLNVWFKQFLKHPGTYIEAFLNGCYGYFYPNKTEYMEGLGAYWITYDPKIYSGKFDIHMKESLLPVREGLENMSYIIRQIPVIGLLFSNGLYTWLTLFLAVMLISRNKWKYVTVFIPCILTILICCVSPVNAYIRYMRPVMSVMPLLISWVPYIIKNNTISDKTIDDIA